MPFSPSLYLPRSERPLAVQGSDSERAITPKSKSHTTTPTLGLKQKILYVSYSQPWLQIRVPWGVYKNPDAQALPQTDSIGIPGVGLVFLRLPRWFCVQPRWRPVACVLVNTVADFYMGEDFSLEQLLSKCLGIPELKQMWSLPRRPLPLSFPALPLSCRLQKLNYHSHPK